MRVYLCWLLGHTPVHYRKLHEEGPHGAHVYGKYCIHCKREL